MSESSKQPKTASPSQAFLDYFRCPTEFACFQSLPEAAVSKGFFRFGSATCFGSLGTGQGSVSPRTIEFDALPGTEWPVSGNIDIHFDPDEVIENLRFERYVACGHRELWLHTLYYLLRPILPLPIRKRLQRLVFRHRLGCVFPGWPVDCSVEQIFEQLMALTLYASGQREIPFIWFWPDGNDSALMMTHDVERQKGADFCEFLMDLDDSCGIKAAFQLIPEGAYKDFDTLASSIRARGFELNIHDLDHDGRLYEHKKLFAERASKINEYGRRYGTKGFRAGAMHRNQEWFHMLSFEYDMSVPTVSHLEPQTGGCCTVTPYFVDNVLELPLTTVQDHGIFHILLARSINLWKQQIEMILAHHGLISFIVHPDYITVPAQRELYRDLLQHIRTLRETRPIWVALPGEVNRWWRERSQLMLVPDGEYWQIRGQGSERARLAFASLVNGKLSYRIPDHCGSLTAAKMALRRPKESASDRPC